MLSFWNVTEKEVFEAAKHQYNIQYEPKITDDDLTKLKKFYKNICGSASNSKIHLFNSGNLSAIYINRKDRFLVFEEGANVEVVNEKDVIDNPFVNVTKDEIDETNAATTTKF